MVHRIVHRVASSDALVFWAERLGDEGVPFDLDGGSLRFSDPEGLDHELVVDTTDDAPLAAVHPEIARGRDRGFEGVRAYSFDPAASAALLEGLMGAAHVDDRFVLRGESAAAGSPSTRRPPSAAARARAPSTTSRGERMTAT